MLFQLKAFVALIEILFGEDSIRFRKLPLFVQLIEAHNVFYKGCAALDEFFPTKVLWAVCIRFQLYLANCTRAKDWEEVICFLINFSTDHQDIITMQFNLVPQLSFKAVDASSDKEPKGGGVLRAKSKKRKKEEEKERRSKKSNDNVVLNTQQCAEFKLKEDESWMQFAGMCLTDRAKLNGAIMCMRWHSRGFYFNDCKNKASHVACSEILAEAKQAHLKLMKTVHSGFK
jgi:hypothetical protein